MNLLAPQFRRPCCTTKAQWHALDFSRRKRPCDLGYGLRKKKIVTIKKYRKSVQSFDPYWMKTLLSLGSYIVEENRKGMVFCYQNFSDLLHNGRNYFYKRQFLALGACSQSWKLNNLSNWLVLQAAYYSRVQKST